MLAEPIIYQLHPKNLLRFHTEGEQEGRNSFSNNSEVRNLILTKRLDQGHVCRHFPFYVTNNQVQKIKKRKRSDESLPGQKKNVENRKSMYIIFYVGIE